MPVDIFTVVVVKISQEELDIRVKRRSCNIFAKDIGHVGRNRPKKR